MVKKRIIKVIAFTVCVILSVSVVSEIVRPVYYSEEEIYTAGIREFCSFYSEAKKSLDVIYIGSSHVYEGISPMEIYEQYGITGYDCTSSSQDSYKAYQYLKEVLKTQSPKVVVYDLMALMIGETTDEISNWSGIGNMKFSYNFLETAWHESDDKSDVLSYIFPVIRYHDRWEELTRKDFTNRLDRDYAKGQDMRYGEIIAVPLTADQFPQFTEAPTEEVAQINEESAENIKKMVRLCNENNIKMLFIKTPVTGYTYESGNAMKTFASECGVDFIDYNLMHEEIGLDWTTDFLDTVHLNAKGRSKVSAHIGQYLVANYALTAHEDSQWDEDAALYDQACKADKMQRTSDSATWFNLIKDENYTICLNGNINCLNEERRTFLNIQNCEYSEENPVIFSYIRNEDNSAVYSQTEEIMQKTEKSKVYIGSGEISINGEKYSVDDGTCRIVVYDNVLNQIVDAVYIDANGNMGRSSTVLG